MLASSQAPTETAQPRATPTVTAEKLLERTKTAEQGASWGGSVIGVALLGMVSGLVGVGVAWWLVSR